MTKYMTALLSGRFDELADPKVQLEQAIEEAQGQHLKLTEQAANVVANQKRIEMDLNKAMATKADVETKIREAIRLAEESDDPARRTKMTDAAEAYTSKLIGVEQEIENLKTLHMGTQEAAQQAKQAIEQNSLALQKKSSEKSKLMSQLEQAKMQEQINSAMKSLSTAVKTDVPSFDEVEKKIQQRQAKALGEAEIHSTSVESHMMEVETAARNSATSSRLAEIKAQMGFKEVTEKVES